MNDEMGILVGALVMFLVMTGLSFWILRRKEPMHFWTGSTVSSSRIKDVKRYNRGMALMFFSFGSAFLVAVPFSLAGHSDGAMMILFGISFGGSFMLPRFYRRIRRKNQA